MRSPFVFIAILVAALLAGLVTPMTPDGGAARAQLLGYGSLTGGGAKPAEDDFFGYSVALDGDRALIGAYLDAGFAGAAHIFDRNPGTGTWGS